MEYDVILFMSCFLAIFYFYHNSNGYTFWGMIEQTFLGCLTLLLIFKIVGLVLL